MTGAAFEAPWLALREPVDHRSRAEGLVERLADWWAHDGGSTVLDLGSGTGSNLRYLAPRLPGAQSWTLVDQDPALLAQVGTPPPEVTVDTRQVDLAEELPAIETVRLVTASALLDLVSRSWLEGVAEACASARCAALFTLSYDGAIEWSPTGDGDELVRNAVNAHQRRDKGLGPGLGPSAGVAARGTFEERGYRTWTSPSPWRLGPGDAGLAHALVLGWAEAAAEQLPAEADRIRAWSARRLETVAEGPLELNVGHLDLLALPGAPRSSES